MKITNPEIKVMAFASEDVIATSAGPLTGLTGLFYIPSAQYGGSFSGNYVQFNGTFGDYSNGAYNITGISGATGGVDSDKAQLESVSNGGVYLPDVGITIPATFLESVAKQTYDAYSYGDGQYYTNGVSYYSTHWQ